MIKLFQKKSVGLEITDRTIELVELLKEESKVSISSKNRVFLKPGIVKKGRIQNEERLLGIVREVFAKAKPHPIITERIIFGLPESQVYIHIFELDPHDKKDRDSLVLNVALKNIPLEKDDVLFSYKVLDESKSRPEFLLVAASKKIVQEWNGFFQKLKFKVDAFDIESLAIFRDLFSKIPTYPVCIVDIGAAITTIAIFDKKGLRYSHSVDVAGDMFTKEIAKTLNINLNEAEEKKIKLGLLNRDSRIFAVLIKALEQIIKEVRVLLNYFQEKNKREIKEIILVGGSSTLNGIVDYFKENLNLPVKLAKSALLKSKIPLEYIEAIGLALRGIDKKWAQSDPCLQLPKQPEANIFKRFLSFPPFKKFQKD